MGVPFHSLSNDGDSCFKETLEVPKSTLYWNTCPSVPLVDDGWLTLFLQKYFIEFFCIHSYGPLIWKWHHLISNIIFVAHSITNENFTYLYIYLFIYLFIYFERLNWPFAYDTGLLYDSRYQMSFSISFSSIPGSLLLTYISGPLFELDHW